MGAMASRQGDYGFDAPYVQVLLGVTGIALLVAGFLGGGVALATAGLFMLGNAASFIYATRRGKFVLWKGLLEGLHLDGDERILDLGCGRGGVLLMAAELVPGGRAVGIDLWRSRDQSGNDEERTRNNAELEGVANRIELHTADMTALPFEADSFDVLLSSLAIHNISDAAGRSKAIDEAVRVMRPGGRLLIADIRSTGEYADRLRELGMADVRANRLGWQGWFGGPWVAMTALSANKPTIIQP